ncbi:PREDICTED: glutathione S-transferase T3-like [Brassica oleracea var. oleracea]|uniref:Myb-like domain-containing protein n=1 Tax=Brassica oleracea var. oleracea TaxID=109376 RepID=A0A0D3ECQ8_BRAOL|nr:PREDICTED: glutathione S-transferase T3-like [Brassica oleracea var. oleracea]
MDPRNIHTQSSSYVGLLHSQQGSVFHENFPYESFHSSVNFGESEIPAFSSQQSEDAPVDTPVERLVRRKWTPADDEVLISAWLNTSKDAIVGNEQKSGTFWNRVGDYYAESPHGGEDGEKREHLHCKKRWQRINYQVNKLCAAYSAAEGQISSGETDTDVLKKAHDIFFSDQEHKFNLEHAWCVLRYEQKWLSLNPPKASGGSKRKNVETNTQTSSNNVVDTESRSEGIKAAKAKRNTAKGKSVAEYATIWEMKKEDLEMKERLSKLAILDTLLAKKEPLSEAEEVVKNKLLAEYF